MYYVCDVCESIEPLCYMNVYKTRPGSSEYDLRTTKLFASHQNQCIILPCTSRFALRDDSLLINRCVEGSFAAFHRQKGFELL